MKHEGYFTESRNSYISKQKEEQENIPSSLKQELDKYNWQAEELKSCILAAQAQDQQAIDKLCACFEPLILKAVHRFALESSYPWEEAYHYSWVYFLDALSSYHNADYSTFPGYMMLRIYSRLKRLIYNNDRIQKKTKWMPPAKYREASIA